MYWSYCFYLSISFMMLPCPVSQRIIKWLRDNISFSLAISWLGANISVESFVKSWRRADISLLLSDQWLIDDSVPISHLQCRNKGNLVTSYRHFLFDFEPVANWWRQRDKSFSILKLKLVGDALPISDFYCEISRVLVIASLQRNADVWTTLTRRWISIIRLTPTYIAGCQR